ncbi:AI-2E family transporter [Oscillatoria laete-virens NRMC-F 0139]|nr:AI-2E family transporter [Oscillatoria laete-virens]MDL5055374.1 AI-2E family transporter [Oscillatoria laete-virens NRMC-F 0139]
MKLSLKSEIWTRMAVAVSLLTAVLAACLYFKYLFLTFLVGVCLLVMAEKLAGDYRARMTQRKMSPVLRIINASSLVLLWIVAILFLIGDSLNQVSKALDQMAIRGQNAGVFYERHVQQILPGWFKDEILTQEAFVRLVELFENELNRGFITATYVMTYGALIIPLLFWYYFRKREGIKKRLMDMLPAKVAYRYSRASGNINHMLRDYLAARVVESILVGAICCLGFYVAGVKGWLIFGVLAGALNVIDFIGPVLGIIAPLAVSLLLQDYYAAGGVVATVIIAQLIDNFYLIPFMLSDRVSIDPLVTVVLIIAGGTAFGILGVILAIPVYLIYKIVLTEVYDELIGMYDPDCAQVAENSPR